MKLVAPPIRAAVIGYGGAFNMGKGHADWMAEAGIQTVAMCDTDPARCEAARADFPDIRTYTDYRLLAKDPDVDLVVVILPHNLHSEPAIELAKAGKHVVMEKPMCITVDEADAMVAAAEAAGTMLSVFHNRRWDGDFMTIRDLVREGLIGDVFQIEAGIGGYGKPGSWWRSDRAIAGSAMHDWGAHFLDWILNIVPSPVAGVVGYMKSDFWTEATIEDHARAVIRFENGCTADLTVSSLDTSGKPKWRLIGTQGSIVANWGDHVTVNVIHAGRKATMEVRVQETRWPEYYRNIAAHLTSGEDLMVKASESRRTISIIEAAMESWETNQVVVPRHR